MRQWTRTIDLLPSNGQKVVVLNGHVEQTLVYDRGLWWLPDRSMYVYFRPDLWHPLGEHIDDTDPDA